MRDLVAIQAVVRSHYAALRACHEAILERDPEAAGWMWTKFVIDTQGEVASACLERADINDHEGAECLLESFRGLRFPSAAREVTVTYPINLAPDPASHELPSGPPPPRGDDHGLKRFVVERER